jgi:hypothetical protein
VAGPFSPLAEVTVARGLLAREGATWLARGFGLKILPLFAGLATESLTFGLGSRALTHLLRGPLPWDPASVITDVAWAGMNLSILRSVNYLNGKIYPGSTFTAHIAAYLGLVGSQSLQAKFFPETHHGLGNIWTDALSSQMALSIGLFGGRAALGKRFQGIEQKIKEEVHRLDQPSKLEWDLSNLLPNKGFITSQGTVFASNEFISNAKGENLWFSVKRFSLLPRARAKELIINELVALKLKLQSPSPKKEDYLTINESLDRMEHVARRLNNQELLQEVCDCYNKDYLRQFLPSLPAQTLPGFIHGLKPLKTPNLQEWINTFGLLQTVNNVHPEMSAREAALPVIEELITRLDMPSLRLLEKVVRENSVNSRLALRLLEKTKNLHPNEEIRQNAKRRTKRLHSALDLRHLMRF